MKARMGLVVSLLFLGQYVFGGGQQCYDIQGENFKVCLTELTNKDTMEVSYRSKADGSLIRELGSYRRMSKGVCLDCNHDFFARIYVKKWEDQGRQHGIQSNPVYFNGRVDQSLAQESGTLFIGSHVFKYSKVSEEEKNLGRTIASTPQ